jgi:uncharacterized protein YndB with AHSA1/START domain
MPMPSSSDHIEKEIRVDAPRSRVWRALANSQEFGQWFGVALEGDFVAGEAIQGQITARGYEHVRFEAIITAMEAEHHFAFRWRPYAIDPAVDYSAEPRTLVTFTLEDAGNGTLLRVVESGFDGIPAARRAKAFEMDSQGWASQMNNIAKQVMGAGQSVS